MKFNIKQITDDNYDNILLGWWQDWGWDAPLKDFLPENGTGGIIIFDDDIPICAGYIYNTNSKVAWIDWIISSKTYRKKPQRKEAMGLLIERLTEAAKSTGAKYAYALIKSNSLIETYEKQGYAQGDSYNKEMIKLL
tara:strand:+ start:3315 stop:3725 length:411 start_codon:yes stop_codon:yes gene_type:complete